MIPYGDKELYEYITEPKEEANFVPDGIKGTVQNINTTLFLVGNNEILQRNLMLDHGKVVHNTKRCSEYK